MFFGFQGLAGTILFAAVSNIMTDIEKNSAVSDSELVALCKKGSTDAYEALVVRYQKKMLNIAFRMVGNYEDACEIVQDAFVSGYKGMKSFREKSSFATWLYTIVLNISRNRIRQQKVQRSREAFSIDEPLMRSNGTIQLEPVSSDPSVIEALEQKDVQKKVQECINRLESAFREVLILRDIQEFSYEEIGQLLSIADGTVKSRLFRARASMKDCLKKMMGER